MDLRLGYLLAERAWGRGLASERIGGFVTWCRAHPEVRSLTGGVAKANPASPRVLEKNGFAPSDESPSSADSVIYRLQL